MGVTATATGEVRKRARYAHAVRLRFDEHSKHQTNHASSGEFSGVSERALRLWSTNWRYSQSGEVGQTGTNSCERVQCG